MNVNLGNYSEALEQQVAALRRLQDERYRKLYAQNWRDRTEAEVRGELAMMSESLVRAETLYIAPELCVMLGRVVEGDPPEWTLNADHLLTEQGWCWFGGDTGYRDPHDGDALLRALSWDAMWANHVDRAGTKGTAFTRSPAADAIRSFRVLVIHPWYAPKRFPNTPGPWAPLVWSFGFGYPRSVDEVKQGIGGDLTASQKHDVVWLGKLFTSLTLFLQQRILTAPQERAERHARKRIEREGWMHEPLIRVVQLRRSEFVHHERHDEPESVDWSCRWIVRGHWRQQACGEGHKERKPIWVMPYTKGPEHKPLKPPRATIFAVVR